MKRERVWPDMRLMPAYSVREVALYLDIPRSTLHAWLKGQRGFKAVIESAASNPATLSFVNLVEAHVLASIRRTERVPLPKVRAAIRFVRQRLGVDRPLADQQFETDGVDLFVQRLGALVNVSQEGQGVMREMVEAALRRISRDPTGMPIRLYPFTRPGQVARGTDDERLIVIDPEVSFGRPVLIGTGIPTAVIAERFTAGDTADELADDYGTTRDAVEEALRCELRYKQAA